MLINKVLKLLSVPFAILIQAIARLTPKSEETWLFSSWNGRKYTDNSRFIYEYALKNYPSLNIYWMCKTKKLKSTMDELGLPACYTFSLKGLYLHLRASRVVVSHSVHWEYCPVFLSSNTKRIQAWHGTPIKKIGYDNILAKKPIYREWISRVFFFYNIDHFDLVLANSEYHRAIYASAFRTDIARVLLTGSPRDDALVNAAGSALRSIEVQHSTALASEVEAREKMTILYAPTLRGRAYSYFNVFSVGGWDFSVIDERLGELNANLIVQLHPAQAMKKSDSLEIDKCRNISYANSETGLTKAKDEISALITDYSGIYFDFLLTDKPIFFYTPDEQEYLEFDREVYTTAEELSPLSPARDAMTLLDQITDYARLGTFDFSRLHEQKTRFHYFSDGKNSERAFFAIKELR